MKYLLRLSIFVSVTLFGCTDRMLSDEEGAAGTWLLTEVGYSPGGGYVTKGVPSNPAQSITLQTDQRVVVTVQGLEDYHFYELAMDTRFNKPVLTLFKTSEEMAQKPAQSHAYLLDFDGRQMKLQYLYCTEGCHMKFRKVESASNE